MKLIIFLKTGRKDCHLKTDKVVCDSCEINCIEESSLHVYFSTFYVPWKYKFFSENRIYRVFTRISSKVNM